MTTALTLRLLGPPEAALGPRESILPASAKARALLAYLVVEAVPVPRGELAVLLWPDVPPDKARLSLRVALAQLRAALPGRIVADGDTIRFSPLDGDTVDVRELASHASEIDGDDAAALWRGPLAEGLEAIEAPEFRAWLEAARARFEAMARAALVRLSRVAADQGRADAAVHALERAAALDPFHEPTAAELLLAMGRAGDLTLAVSRFEALRAALADEFGAEPSPELLAVRERLVAARGRGRRSAVPVPDTAFVGRAGELAEVMDALSGAAGSVVTIVGPGGIGKTRLAVEVAGRLAGRFLDGVRFVPLAGLDADSSLAPSLALALDLQSIGAAPALDRIEDALREREVLVVLDNFETIAEQAADCGRLAGAARTARILVTSRQPLGLPGERIVRLAGLGFPSAVEDPLDPARHESVALFVAAARRARRDFSPETELPAIGAICRHVEGYPLALELAAPWVAEADCEAIAARLAADLGAVPAAGGLPDRHATLRAVFEQSWGLLEGPERLAFARLCVFRGGFDAAAAAAVGVSVGQVEALVGRSLVHGSTGGRYGVHEVLRHFGAARLDAATEVATRVRDGHAHHYLGRFAALSAAGGADSREVVEFVEADADNLRAAWRRAVAGRSLGLVAACAADLAAHYYAQGPNDAGIELGDDLEAWLGAVAAEGQGEGGGEGEGGGGDGEVASEARAGVEGGSPVEARESLAAVAARLVAERGFFELRMGRSDRAQASAERALEIAAHGSGAGLDAARSAALRLRGIDRRTAGDLDGAAADLDEAEARARRAGDERLWAEAAYHRAGLAVYRGDVGGCIAATRTVLDSIAGRGFARLECALRFTLSVLMDRAGDVMAGEVESRRCLATAEGIGYRLGEMNAATAVGLLAYRRGRLTESIEHLERGIRLALDLGHTATERNARYAVAVALADLGRPAEAMFHAERALRLAEVSGEARGTAHARLRLAYIRRTAHDLESAAAHARAALATFESLGDVAGAAHALAEVGRIALRSGDDVEAAISALDAAVSGLAESGDRVQWLVARLLRVRAWRAREAGRGGRSDGTGADADGRPGGGERPDVGGRGRDGSRDRDRGPGRGQGRGRGRDRVDTGLRAGLAEATAVRDEAAGAGVVAIANAAEIVRGRILLSLGALREASRAFERALAWYEGEGLSHLAADAAAGSARCLVAEGRRSEAAALAAAQLEGLSRHRLYGVEDPDEVVHELREVAEGRA